MNITVAELLVIMDTLHGSSYIADRSDKSIFAYTRETRAELSKVLTERLRSIVLTVNTKADSASEGRT